MTAGPVASAIPSGSRAASGRASPGRPDIAMIVLAITGRIGLAATFLLPAAEPAPETGIPATAAKHTPG